MQLLELTPEQMKIAKDAVSARFLNNSVAYQCIPIEPRKKDETIIRWDRYDYNRSMVIDNETLSLIEPYAIVNLSSSQRYEAKLERGMTSVHRKTSELARLFDSLAFVGLEESIRRKNSDVEIPSVGNGNFVSLREAAIQVEEEEGRGAILVDPPDSQELLVAAAFEAVVHLEKYGYFSNFFSVWGERIYSLLQKPNKGDLVLPRERIQPTIPDFYRSTTLPDDEALIVSLDGPTLKYVVACLERDEENETGMAENMNMGDQMPMGQEYLFFEPLRIEANDRNEEIYKYRIKFRAVPSVQENRSIIRIKLAQPATSNG